MPKNSDTSPAHKRGRLIHQHLDAETHRRLRMAITEHDETICSWVATRIEREFDGFQAPNGRKGM